MEKLKILHSLKFRLGLLLIAFGVLPGALLCVGLLKTYESREVSAWSKELFSYTRMLSTQIANSNFLEDPSSEVVNAQLELLGMIFDGRVLVIDDHFVIIKDTYGLDQGKFALSAEAIKSSQGEDISKYDAGKRYIKISVPIKDSQSQKIIGTLGVGVSTASIVSNYTVLKDIGLVMELVMGTLMVAIAVFAAIRVTKPFSRITTSIDEFQFGEDEEGISVPDYTETQSISKAFNALLNRLQVIEQSRQEFVSNVSHELKTPLTSMKVLADTLKDQDNVPVEMYQEFMSDISDEIERETIIINDLLSLVKLDKAAGSLNVESVNINDLLELILKRLRPIAEKQNIELVLESFRPVTAEIDEVKLTLALSNLIENAIKYNRENGWVHVSLNADHKFFFVRVEDSGIGIPEKDLEHIYERFFRVEKSHSREIGGTGLGLAITRNAVLMHRGAIKAHSVMGEGTIFSVRIPLNYVAPDGKKE